MAKKEKYIPKTGLTGEGEDYNIYKLKPREMVIGFLIGAAGGFAAAQIMFGVAAASIVIGAATGVAAIPIYRNYLLNKRRKSMLLQFRDLLDALATSFSSGKNTDDAFSDAYQDLRNLYSDDTPMVREVGIIVHGLTNRYVIEDLLRDTAERCGLDDINSFAETFAVCNRMGGSLKKIVSESRDIISDKIEVEMEIQTTIAASKNDINIMSMMPFVVVAMMGTLGNSSITDNTLPNVIVKIIALGLFAVAYYVGMKISDIKV